VLRLLDCTRLDRRLDALGLDHEALALLRDALARPHGLLLATGPTGSGKTTTLYAALAALDTAAINVCTVEDPVEVHLHGVNQVHAREDVGLSFATALRALLRQDPDVIMVGEIRDLDTADIAVKAALTGHLVLSTLHTNDAASAVTRLLDMGIPPFLVAGSLVLIVAQRLVRVVCARCSRESTVQADVLRTAGWRGGPFSPRRGGGCRECAGAGVPRTYGPLRADAGRRRAPRTHRCGSERARAGTPRARQRDAHASSERPGARRCGRHVDRGSAARHTGGRRRNQLSAAVSHRFARNGAAARHREHRRDDPAWHDPCSCLDRCAASNRSSRRP